MDVERDVVLPASPEEVWGAITQPDRIAHWFGAEVEIDLVPGGGAHFTFPDGGSRQAVVVDVDPSRRFSFEWDDGTLVEFVLEEVEEGTHLTVVESNDVALVTWAPPTRGPIGFQMRAVA